MNLHIPLLQFLARTLTEMAPQAVDYSLYLVTDSTTPILGDKDLVAVVKAAVEGGRVTLPMY